MSPGTHNFCVLYTCSQWLKTMFNSMIGGSTYYNMKNSITLVSENAYFLRPVNLFVGDVQTEVHSRHLLQEVITVTSVQGNASHCPSPTTVPIQYLFPRCSPCLSWRRIHNQMQSATMDKCKLQISETMHFWTLVY